MPGSVARNQINAAVALHRSHPHASALNVLDAVILHGVSRLADFGDGLDPCSDFGQLLADAFDKGMSPDDWKLLQQPLAPAVRDALLSIWRATVLPQFAARYSLTA